jgi:hypothetical protein
VIIERLVPDAVETALSAAIDAGAGVVITGSVAMVGQARTLFGHDPL